MTVQSAGTPCRLQGSFPVDIFFTSRGFGQGVWEWPSVPGLRAFFHMDLNIIPAAEQGCYLSLALGMLLGAWDWLLFSKLPASSFALRPFFTHICHLTFYLLVFFVIFLHLSSKVTNMSIIFFKSFHLPGRDKSVFCILHMLGSSVKTLQRTGLKWD